MLVPTLVMAAVAAGLYIFAASRGHGQHWAGLKAGARLGLEILPLLIFAFLVAGLIQALLPRELVARWVGEESGLRGILIGSGAGALAMGGPYVVLPIAAGLLRAGASVGALVAFVTGWSLWNLGRLPMEVGFLGWRLTLIRIATTLLVPPVAGWLAHLLAGAGRGGS